MEKFIVEMVRLFGLPYVEMDTINGNSAGWIIDDVHSQEVFSILEPQVPVMFKFNGHKEKSYDITVFEVPVELLDFPPWME